MTVPYFLPARPPGDGPGATGDPAPFLIERTRTLEPDGHHFVPGARLVVTPALRTSGLLAALPGEEAKTLLMLMTFLSSEGTVRPSLPEVADGLRLPSSRARERLRRLEAFRWEGRPLLRHVPPEQGFGLDRYVPDATLFAAADAAAPRQGEHRDAPAGPPPAGRAAVLAHSRAMYGRLRAEVERDIEGQLRAGRRPSAGHAAGDAQDAGPPLAPRGDSDSPADHERARAALLAYGVPAAEVEKLLALYPAERIVRQAAWMPLRGAREPARFLVSAVVRDFAPPLRARLRTRTPVPLLRGTLRAEAGDGAGSRASMPATDGEGDAPDRDVREAAV